jgi:hypothetical protein
VPPLPSGTLQIPRTALRCSAVAIVTIPLQAFTKSVEDVLTEGFIEKVDQDTGTMRVSGGDHAAGGGGAAAGRA